MIEVAIQFRKLMRDKFLSWFLLRCDLPCTLAAFINELKRELKR